MGMLPTLAISIPGCVPAARPLVSHRNEESRRIGPGRSARTRSFPSLFKNVDRCKTFHPCGWAETVKERESLEHSIHILGDSSYKAKAAECRHRCRSGELTATSRLNGPRLLLLSVGHWFVPPYYFPHSKSWSNHCTASISTVFHNECKERRQRR